MTIIIPTASTYTNDAGQPVFWIEGAARGSRLPDEVELLVVHHSGGTDSRKYLAENAVDSSSTYLIGEYAGIGLRVYKYMSEANATPYTQGLGSIGGLPLRPSVPYDNINRRCVAIEMEWPGVVELVPDARLFVETAKLSASILRYWRTQGKNLLLVGHKHIDDRKVDPKFNWTAFCKKVYELV